MTQLTNIKFNNYTLDELDRIAPLSIELYVKKSVFDALFLAVFHLNHEESNSDTIDNSDRVSKYYKKMELLNK